MRITEQGFLFNKKPLSLIIVTLMLISNGPIF